jgi:hypothetical protein
MLILTTVLHINVLLPNNANEIKLNAFQNLMLKYGQQNIKLEFMYDTIYLGETLPVSVIWARHSPNVLIVGCPVLKKTLSYRVWVNG